MEITLPIHEVIPEVKEKLLKFNTLILQAPPGAGKSTVLPLELMNEPWLNGKKIIMLEPRRLAARSVATRMADLINEEIGKKIGYRVRFENKVSTQTQIEVVTEGILTRMIQSDNTLEDVGLIIFDEFHERSLQADLALALATQVQQVLRTDLRLLIMSATLDGEKLSRLLNNAPIVTSSGKQFLVEIKYMNDSTEEPIAFKMARAIQEVLNAYEGDVLAFLPGAGEINKVQQLLDEKFVSAKVMPLYGDLSYQKQREAILPDKSGQRKVVLTTSIAETSLTIEGITVVIDSGLARVPKFDHRSGFTRLETVKVTKDAADQRAGRAGRLGPGVCYRLWTQGSNLHLNDHRSPEILEADLAPLMLELSQWGIKNINELTWLTSPPIGAVVQANELLQQLEAVDDGKITIKGKQIVRLPTHPRIAHMLLEAQELDKTGSKHFLPLATDIAALLEERDPLSRDSGTDLVLRIEALRKYRNGERVNADRGVLDRIEKLAKSWRILFKVAVQNSIVSETDAGKLLMLAYPERVAKRADAKGTRYRLANGRSAKLNQTDPLSSYEWLSVAQLDAGVGEGRIFVAAALDKDDLVSIAHEYRSVKWDDERQMIVGEFEKRFGCLVVQSRPLDKITEEDRVRLLCELVRSKGLKILNFDERVTSFRNRVLSLKKWRANESWPEMLDDELLSELDKWFVPFISTIRKLSELQQLDVVMMLSSLLSYDQQQKLEVLVPEKLEVPSGSLITLNYSAEGAAPEMPVRLQEVFGMMQTPTVNEGKVKVMMHLLSPAYRPVQVTQDLQSFWKNTYAEVRKEIRMRYPKHSWPEDPYTAQAVRGVKRKWNLI